MFITLLIFLISIFVVESKTNPWVIFSGVIGGIIFLIVAIVFFLWISKQNFVCFTFVYFKFCLFQICHNGSKSAKCGNLISFSFYFQFQLALLDMYHFYIMFHLKFFFFFLLPTLPRDTVKICIWQLKTFLFFACGLVRERI